MRLYKVENWVYELANSLLPPREPTPAEVIPLEEAMVTPSYREIIEILVRLGYTRYQADMMYKALITHYWYDFGIRDIMRIHELIKFWIGSHVAPAWIQAAEKPPPWLPPAWVAAVIVIGMITVAYVLSAPDYYKDYKWTPPCDSYIATFEESLWWMTLVQRDWRGRLWYKIVGMAGGVITAHTFEYIAPPVVTDRFHFWGTMEFRCWEIPWFRVYRAQHVDTTFVGFLEHRTADYYILKPDFNDPFAPPGRFVIPTSQYCRAWSPCQA